MQMKKLLLFLIIVSSPKLFSQSNSDTIKVATLQDFSQSAVFHHVTRVRNLSVRLAKLTTTGLENIEATNFGSVQSPTNSKLRSLTDNHRGLGPSVQFTVTGYIEEPGNYQLTLTLSSLGDFNDPNKVMVKRFNIIVDYPKLLSLGVIRNKYFLGETSEFNLAMSGLENKNDYSYVVLDSGTNDTLKTELGSPVVKLDEDITMSKREKTIDLYLLYKNRPFEFKLPNNSIMKSEFIEKISIVKPELEFISQWAHNDTGYNPIVLENPKALRIDVRYRGGSIKGYFKYIDLQIKGRPGIDNTFEDDGLINDLVEFDKIINSGFNGRTIILKPTEKYNNLDIFKDYKTKITIRLITQFESIVRTFTANLYK